MNTFIKRIILLVLFTQTAISFSQQDTIFWFAAPDISSVEGESPIFLNLTSYNNSSNVIIDQPANAGFLPININLSANSKSTIDLTLFIADIESSGADIVGNSGLRIVSTELISASYEILHPTNREMFSLKGNKGIGSNFYTPFQNFWNTASVTPSTYSSIEIVATENGTTVAISPKTNIVGHPTGTTFTINLDEG